MSLRAPYNTVYANFNIPTKFCLCIFRRYLGRQFWQTIDIYTGASWEVQNGGILQGRKEEFKRGLTQQILHYKEKNDSTPPPPLKVLYTLRIEIPWYFKASSLKPNLIVDGTGNVCCWQLCHFQTHNAFLALKEGQEYVSSKLSVNRLHFLNAVYAFFNETAVQSWWSFNI